RFLTLLWRRRALVRLVRCAPTRAATGSASASFPRVQGIGDRRAAPRDGDPAPSHLSTVDDDGGPGLLSGGESAVAAPFMERILRQAGHAAGLASAAGGSALDVSATTRPQADEPRRSRAESAGRPARDAVGARARG